ncbi:unnamed protein product, partial [Ectocarpus sp. 13 AM-2016]
MVCQYAQNYHGGVVFCGGVVSYVGVLSCVIYGRQGFMHPTKITARKTRCTHAQRGGAREMSGCLPLCDHESSPVLDDLVVDCCNELATKGTAHRKPGSRPPTRGPRPSSKGLFAS